MLHGGSDGAIGLTSEGRDWLLEADRPSRVWGHHVAPPSPPLRDWQTEALDAWSSHGRHGVIEAVTGTGKSRVGVEAAREALDDDYNVIVMVPTIDLVEQWAKTLRQHGLPSVGALGDGQRASLRSHRVIVGTVQSLYLEPPTRPDGKILLIADECHRYGAGQWRRALHPSYRRRLGLTATFERNDDGLGSLLRYFGGPPVFRIGFPRAIRDGVVAHYDVQLLGVPLTSRERADYDEADRTARDSRIQLLAAGFPAQPFGAFLHEVQRAAEDDPDPTISDVARRYLKAFSARVDVMTNAQAKLDVTGKLAARVNASGGAILFTRRVDMAEEISATLVEAGVKAAPIHSDLSRGERKDRLAALRAGRLKAVVAPTVLDEGIDVPDINLAVVMGGSRSRRQMIQRMGRVLRLKPEGGKATFVVVYALGTAEDLGVSDGTESCLDLIVECADSVSPLTLDDDKIVPSDLVHRRTIEPSPPFQLDDVAPATHPLQPGAVRDYRTAHGTEEKEATESLRRLLHDLLLIGSVRPSKATPDDFLLSNSGFELVVSADGVTAYRSRRPDAATWEDLADGETEATRVFDDSVESDVVDDDAVSSIVPTPDDEPAGRTAQEVTPHVSERPGALADHSGLQLIDHLERLAALHREGLLTAAEFSIAKSRLLG
ncbi:hypothetical protein GCM10027026_04480 [Myroides odoratimimus subsp. xuanwuensis]